MNGGMALLAAVGGSAAIPFEGSLDFQTGSYNCLTVAKFPDKAWAPNWRAQLLLAEFAAQPWFDLAVAPVPVPDLCTEIPALVADVWLRGARMAEIMAQADDFSFYWADMLMVTPGSRPNTWLMITTMMSIGTLVVMKYKHLRAQPRPVQIYPALMPCLLTPGHPSFPSGHALQCFLIADCLNLANPALGQTAYALAERIARNREIAGLHFPRDQKASREVADHLKQFLYRDNKTGVMDSILAGIREEYSDVQAGGPAIP